ncbi:MAG: helix-turn-helix domain-containing protein [Acidimicrobiales bacterium]
MDEISIGEFARRSHLSLKALRLYDELGVLLPARVDKASGYRFYDTTQLEDARLIAMLRQLDVPLADVKELLARSRQDAAARIAEHWQRTESQHGARRDLATYLVNQLSGKKSIMYEVSTREMPERTLLCLKRNVDWPGAWAFGKEFIAIIRERPLPKIPGRQGAMFSIYWGLVNDDSDGPVEWCWPVAASEAAALAPHYPELALRTEPAHQEAFVTIAAVGDGAGASWQLASEALDAWRIEQGITPEDLAIKPEDLGIRITYLASGPVSESNVPDDYCDFAVPFALKVTA